MAQFAVKDIQANPFRHIDRYPIRREKVDVLRESLRATRVRAFRGRCRSGRGWIRRRLERVLGLYGAMLLIIAATVTGVVLVILDEPAGPPLVAAVGAIAIDDWWNRNGPRIRRRLRAVGAKAKARLRRMLDRLRPAPWQPSPTPT